MKNNKGFTLIEVLIAALLLGMLMMSGMAFIKYLNIAVSKAQKKADKIQKQVQTAVTVTVPSPSPTPVPIVNPAVEPGADERNFVGTLNQCVPLKGTNGIWYAKRIDARTVEFFQQAPNCNRSSLGTLSALNNPTYDDTVTDTFWNVSGDGTTLRVLVRKLNLKK